MVNTSIVFANFSLSRTRNLEGQVDFWITGHGNLFITYQPMSDRASVEPSGMGEN